MTRPQRQPATAPALPKAPTTGHPARRLREEDPATAPAHSQREQLVNFGARIPESVRRRARMYAVTHDVELQDLLADALVEYLDRHETD